MECGIIALIDIALYSENGEPVTVCSISKRQNISIKYLEQILMILRQSHLVRSQKGSKGGYVVGRPPEKITLREVLDALDVTILGDTVFNDSEKESELKDIIDRNLWNKMTVYLREFSESITLAEIIEQYRKSLAKTGDFMYYI